MPSNPVAAVMIHVAHVGQAQEWYLRAFPSAERMIAPGTGFECLRLGAVQLEIVPADEKVASGAAGSVVYWQMRDLGEAMRHFTALGATLYRGPIPIELGLGICQVKVPWGNYIGLRGPFQPAAPAE
ncbi:glyoxalase/bleomycin resistance/dioxygenase family protein [Jeongeupia chitinilytica]|uniref:Glyoxalase/bleomycin resistance/dioxygenase family protein n=1 Tax=Jeongeupia chitinilytica TaxID=1041641 RepID=A0ABQ3GWT4_9NEIS|nr:glyoxalase/bleomycin resistance/dioxygenase family protein [Jeongeupia chitinilytica]GHD56283.1 hypothetical protein GCM10007350_03030 [Jeongeupia chitinilytica]